MKDKGKKDSQKVNESPSPVYKNREMHIFNSFAEQEAYELKQMAALTPIEILQQMRQFITIAYSIQGYDPDHLPLKHSIRIITE